MIENEQIVNKIVEGIQERKGKDIIVINLTKLQDAPCSFFVICQGDSSIHTNAVAHSVRDYVRDQTGIKPLAIDGFENSEWIAIDYGQIIVHVFQAHAREFYDIERLWADAELTKIENLD